MCCSCIEEAWRKPRKQGQHLGGDPSPLSPVSVDTNEHRILTDLQRLWCAAGFEAGSPFAVGFDIGAFIVIAGTLQ